jgi:hypothetical protein
MDDIEITDMKEGEEVIEQKKEKLLFSLPVVFGVGIVTLLISLAVFTGQAGLQSQLGTRVMTTPGVSETPAEPSEDPFPSGWKKCPWERDLLPELTEPPPIHSSSSSDVPSETPVEPIDSIVTECGEANCWTELDGTLQPFPGEKECIKGKPQYCKKGDRQEIHLKSCDFDGPVKQENCKLVEQAVLNFNSGCWASDPTANCPDVEGVIGEEDTGECRPCWFTQNGAPKAACFSYSMREVRGTIQCEKVPKEEGQDGYRVDRTTCAYDKKRSAPLSACYQSCQVIHIEADKNCEEQPLHPGECRLNEDGPPPDIILPPSTAPLI